MCTRPPVRRALSITVAIGRVLGPPGPGGEEVGVALGRAAPGPGPMAAASSACTMSSAVEAGQHRQDASQLGRVSGGNSVTPESEQEALEAEHAGVVQRAQLADVAGDRAAPEADVDVALARGGLRLTSSAATSTVGGMLLSGMSTIVVTPPAAAARVAWRSPPTRSGPAR